MPDRIIRASCRTSPTIDRLSPAAEVMCWRLTTCADDYGRFPADPRILLAECFPLRVDRYKPRQVMEWFKELVRAGMVATYEVDGKLLGYFINWDKYQRLRAKRSKYPAPTSDNICRHVTARDARARAESESESESESEEKHTRSRALAVSAPAEFEGFWLAYPRKVGKGAALKAWRGAAAKDAYEVILAGLHRQREAMASQEERYIPHPATWLNQERWKDEPAAVNGNPFGKQDMKGLQRFVERGE